MDHNNAVWIKCSLVNGKITDEEKLGMRRRATSYVTNQTRNGEGGTWERNGTCLEPRKSLLRIDILTSASGLQDHHRLPNRDPPPAKDAIFITRLLHLAHHHEVGKDDFQAPGNVVKKIAILSDQKH